MKKIVSLFLLLLNCTVFSQWNPSAAINNTVCIQPNQELNPKMTSDLKGGAIIVWEDYRNDATQTSGDIYAQRISSDGTVMWQINGIAICNDIADQAAPVIVTDSSGGAVIVWQDRRGAKRNLYAQHIDSSGNIIWTSNGIAVALRNYDQKNPKLLNDGNHGTIVIWQDSVGGAYDIYGQRLSANGTQQWSNGIGICTTILSQVNPKAQITAAGSIYITWEDKRNGSDYDVYMQKLDLSGSAQWTANGISICNIASNQTNPKISLDATQLPILIWQDKRNGLDYDIYVQRVNASGISQWTANGLAICTASGSQSGADLTTIGISTGAIFAWKDARNGTSNVDIYAQMINLSGATQWASNGIVIANASHNQLAPNVISDGKGGAIISYQDSSAGNWDIKAQRINTSGTILWTTGGASVGIANGDQTNQSNILAGSGNSIYVFQDMRSGNNDIYAYKLDTLGHVYSSLNNIQTFFEKNSVQVFPNPSNDKIQFELSGQNKKWNIIITDINGKEILRDEILNSNNYTFSQKPVAGIYFYQITSSNNLYNGKIVIIN